MSQSTLIKSTHKAITTYYRTLTETAAQGALTRIPPKTFSYKLGNRSMLEWIIDQYQLYTDPRTKITSDPNAWSDEHDDPEYIVNLIGRIVTVSLETMKIVNSLPKEFAESK